MHRKLPILSLLVLLAPQLYAADLSRIERTIRKEPVYQSKTPRYCLLVFGPEAKTHVWLVLDGKTLYVDRNGNGDLTDDGERIAAQRGLEIRDEDIFEVDQIHEGARTHKNLTLTVRKVDSLATRYESLKKSFARLSDGRGYQLSLAVDLAGSKRIVPRGYIHQGAGPYDEQGFLNFADKPHDAPIIHFGGPWQIQSDSSYRLMRGHELDLMLSILTPGLGSGATSYLFYPNTIPQDVHPLVEITYPPSKPGQPPLKSLYELKERC